jgi:mono/diheme cytochrome c family protein
MMNAILFSSFTIGLGLMSGACLAQESDAERGQKTFMRVGCFQCHGTNGQGSEAGTALTPEPLPAEAIANFIRFSPGRMPVYPEDVLSDDEIADITAFLESVPPPPSPDSIPILRDMKIRD